MSNIPNTGPSAPPPPVWDAQPAGAGAATGFGGFWIRVVAYIIDAIVLATASSVIGLVVGAGGVMNAADPQNPAYWGAQGVSLIVGLLYFGLLESSERGATLGKMALGLRVVTDQGQRLSLAHAIGRYLAKFVSAITLGIGFIMVAFTERKRGLHDMIAGTLVVKVR